MARAPPLLFPPSFPPLPCHCHFAHAVPEAARHVYPSTSGCPRSRGIDPSSAPRKRVTHLISSPPPVRPLFSPALPRRKETEKAKPTSYQLPRPTRRLFFGFPPVPGKGVRSVGFGLWAPFLVGWVGEGEPWGKDQSGDFFRRRGTNSEPGDRGRRPKEQRMPKAKRKNTGMWRIAPTLPHQRTPSRYRLSSPGTLPSWAIGSEKRGRGAFPFASFYIRHLFSVVSLGEEVYSTLPVALFPGSARCRGPSDSPGSEPLPS